MEGTVILLPPLCRFLFRGVPGVILEVILLRTRTAQNCGGGNVPASHVRDRFGLYAGLRDQVGSFTQSNGRTLQLETSQANP